MAINVYTGVMGSGKSYECVAEIIIPAIAAGRRVVTNIYGVDETKIHEYLKKKKRTYRLSSSLGSVLLVEDKEIESDTFFPDADKPEVESVVKPGDLVVIDEAWRFWRNGLKIRDNHMQYFRMHRHYIHSETGVSSDLALIFQSITDVSRQLRSVIEMTVRTVKLKSLGFSSRYRVEFYGGDKVQASNITSRIYRKYNKEIFPLYQSYAGSSGKESQIDKRQNILRNPMIIIWFFVVVGGLAFSGYHMLSRFSGPPSQSRASESNDVSLNDDDSSASGLNYVSSYSDSDLDEYSISFVGESIDWRLAGQIRVHGASMYVLVDSSGRYRYVESSKVYKSGVFSKIGVNGMVVNRFSGNGVVLEDDSDD